MTKEKRKLWSDWKRGLVDTETYLVAKRIARRAIYKAKTEAEKARFANIQRRDIEKNEIFRIAKQMAKTNQELLERNSSELMMGSWQWKW